jgi:hypothetical protein
MIFKLYSRQSNHDNTTYWTVPGGRWSVFILNLWSIWFRGGRCASCPFGPQQLQFRERLTQEIMTHTRLRPWAMAGMLNENVALRLGLAEKLAGMLDPGIWRWCG